MAKKKNVSVISVEKPTWFPLTDETGAFPVYGTPITIGTAVSIKPDVTTETTPDYGDSVVQDQYVAFGGAEVTLETNGYQNEVLAEITGGKKLKGGVLRSADDIASDGAFAYRRRKSNGKYRYTIFYKGKFALTSDETSTLEGSSVSYTHPEWTGSFVEVPGLGYMYSVDEDDEGVDLEMIKNWFTEVMDPRKENTTAVTGVTLDQTELNLKVGQTATLTPTITPDNASNKKYQFRSESEAIGTVTPIQGKVTAVGEGTTEIVVTTEDGNFTAKCTLNVTTAD
ncbi:major tail protein [Enterococcus sp. S163_ASV_20]|uniref:major tail protein n=3 Tax=Enterococcus TaxID=1350 RepID=UPI001C120F31|nr:major tail protein [Enterococcus sp. S163_ASV_20]MBU5519181.1 Ig-like domain-containing protein [Enterococcus sp. S163_ASV_20]